jgi:hypothetical protein
MDVNCGNSTGAKLAQPKRLFRAVTWMTRRHRRACSLRADVDVTSDYFGYAKTAPMGRTDGVNHFSGHG